MRGGGRNLSSEKKKPRVFSPGQLRKYLDKSFLSFAKLKSKSFLLGSNQTQINQQGNANSTQKEALSMQPSMQGLTLVKQGIEIGIIDKVRSSRAKLATKVGAAASLFYADSQGSDVTKVGQGNKAKLTKLFRFQ